MLPVKLGAYIRYQDERTTAAELADELDEGKHVDCLPELEMLIAQAEKRRSLGARW